MVDHSGHIDSGHLWQLPVTGFCKIDSLRKIYSNISQTRNCCSKLGGGQRCTGTFQVLKENTETCDDTELIRYLSPFPAYGQTTLSLNLAFYATRKAMLQSPALSSPEFSTSYSFTFSNPNRGKTHRTYHCTVMFRFFLLSEMREFVSIT